MCRDDRLAAPLRVMTLLPTETLTSEPLTTEQKVSVVPLPIFSVSFRLNRKTKSSPSSKL